VKKGFVCVFVVGLAVAMAANAGVFTSENPVDLTRSTPPVRYVPTPADLAYTGTTAGDAASGDIQSLGSDVAYIGLVLNSDGVNQNAPHLFIKIQQQGNAFAYGACYLGYNGSAGMFGMGFFPLMQPFTAAHMQVSRSGSTVTIKLTHVTCCNIPFESSVSSALPNQTYTCSDAPAPVGDKIGANGLHPVTHTPRLRNFGNGSRILDRFNYFGPVGNTGAWTDVVPGMHGHIWFAEAGDNLPTGSMSFWMGGTKLVRIPQASGAQGTTMYLRVSGTDLQLPGTTIDVSGSGVNVTMINDDSENPSADLTAKLVIDRSATIGTRAVTVKTPTGETSNALPFTITGQPAACPVSLPITASGSGGNLNITTGIGTTRLISGRWVTGWMVFNPRSVSFYGTTLSSGLVPLLNPPMSRLLSANVGSVPAVAVVNAFYSPSLCGYTVTWTSTGSSAAPQESVPRSEVEAVLRSIASEEFDGTSLEIPR
jgi:hypothetical protein